MKNEIKFKLMENHWHAVWFGDYDLARLIYKFLVRGYCKLYFSDADQRFEVMLEQLGAKIKYDDRGIANCDGRFYEERACGMQ